ncbi:MAG: Fic family protein [Acidobacteriia bacterium]|nr:Fic family protein [Terriglobia bacterium]
MPTLHQPMGQAWLRQELGLNVPSPAVESYIAEGARRTEFDGSQVLEYYPRRYETPDTAVSHLRFTLRNEAFDIGLLVAALRVISSTDIEAWVRSQPTGGYGRRAWYLYETFTGRTLDLEDVRFGNYVPLLDTEKHFVGLPQRSRRHRVTVNLLGTAGFCPTVRRTRRLKDRIQEHFDQDAKSLLASVDPIILTRAVNYLYSKETRSTFEIEGETASASRAERFVAALTTAAEFDAADKSALVDLQRTIVEPRYAARNWRSSQVFVGHTRGGFREHVDFVCPRPQDVPELMEAWTSMTRRVLRSDLHAVVAAAVVGFSFVFIHPFVDGNGRIHRFLLQHVLSKLGYSPSGVIFPISASIVRNLPEYDSVLQSFSKPLSRYIDWHWTPDLELVVDNDTADQYRYFDATRFAEYLFDRVEDTLREDLREELNFVAIFDKAFSAVRQVVEMPDRRASLLVRLCMQNGGRLSARKRKQFSELSDAEVSAMEAGVRAAMESAVPSHPDSLVELLRRGTGDIVEPDDPPPEDLKLFP